MKKAVLAFMPVLHSGYIKFFSKNNEDVFLIGRDFSSEILNVDREIRMLEPEQSALALSQFVKKVEVLGNKNLPKFLDEYQTVTMPDEDVSRNVAGKYLKSKEVIFEKVFLRWDKLISMKELEVAPDRKISSNELDKYFIGKAVKQSDKSSDWWRQIGAVVVKNGEMIIEGYNKHIPSDFSPYINGDPRNNFNYGEKVDLYTSIHAEALVITKAAKQGISLDGCSMYVSTFPCSSCARLLAESGIKKVFYSKGYSVLDSENVLKHYGIEIVLVK